MAVQLGDRQRVVNNGQICIEKLQYIGNNTEEGGLRNLDINSICADSSSNFQTPTNIIRYGRASMVELIIAHDA